MTTFPIQDHIHLSDVLSGSPENAPSLRWKITDRLKVPNVIMSINRAISGKLRVNVLQRGGLPADIIGYQYILTVADLDGIATEDRVNALVAMQGKRVYLCDSLHPQDGIDHTAAIKPMVFSKLGEFKVFSPMLPRYYVEIFLEDDHL